MLINVTTIEIGEHSNFFNKGIYRLENAVQKSGNCTFYYLEDGPERTFVSEELPNIPGETEVLLSISGKKTKPRPLKDVIQLHYFLAYLMFKVK